MRVGAVLLSRFDSSRLPGKALADIIGRPLIWYSLSRVKALAAFDGVMLATSERAVDDPIAEYARSQGVAVYRGDADDVAGRFLAAAEEGGFDAVARINADCPLPDMPLLERACRVIREGDVDIVTNMMPRTYPYGIVVELLRTDAFRGGYSKMSVPEHFEHVTKYFYDNPEVYRFANLECDGCDPDVLLQYRFTVDKPAQLEAFRRFVAALSRPWLEVTFEDAVAFGSFGE